MTKSAKKTLILNGLSCANCAAKIERGVNKIAGVQSASVDFVSKRMTIEADPGENLEKIVTRAKEIARNIETNIEMIDENQPKIVKEENQPSFKPEWIRLGIGALLFGIALIGNFTFWVSAGLFVTSYVLIGGDVVIRAGKNILKGQVFDENFLMSIATIGAFSIQQFAEGVAVMLFYQVGELFQTMAVDHSRRSISALMDIRPDYANLLVGDVLSKVDPEKIKIGDSILIKPGEKVPLDGIVTSGFSMLNTAAITGESLPRDVEPGDDILSGTINMNGLLTVEVTKEFGESTVSKILDLVQNASSKKAPTEKFITKFARYYTPAVVFIALALAVIPPLVIQGATFHDWVYRALVFLVVSCPCALVISIPLGFFGGIGAASKQGILMKGGNYLEALNAVDTVVFDKTGTLTKGKFQVTKIVNLEGFSEDELIEIAAFAERYSSHPIARSILAAYGKKIDDQQIEGYEEIPGHGIKVRVSGKDVLAGNAKLMDKGNIVFEKTDEIGSIVHISVSGKYAGYIVISDEVKEDAYRTIKGLRALGIKKLIMLTGDSKSVGDEIGEKLGLDEVYAELLPDQKVDKLESIGKERQTKGALLFVGDGINDAPALTLADVGIAMGGLGSDAAISAADIVIMTDEPEKLIGAIQIAKRTRRIVWQNILFAFVVKGLVLILGAIGIATMWEAVFADVGVALIAVLNAMRILGTKIDGYLPALKSAADNNSMREKENE